MKKLFAICLSLCMVLSLCACGSKPAEDSSTDGDTTTTDQKPIEIKLCAIDPADQNTNDYLRDCIAEITERANGMVDVQLYTDGQMLVYAEGVEAVMSNANVIVHRYEDSLKLVGEDPRDGNPSPGNKAGGLTTLEEKSLGCIHKGGHRPVEEVYDYAKQMEYGKGLVIMDTPGNDPSSVAGMAAGGCQLVLFSTGRGTPTGNPIAPVIKLTANPITYGKMKDNIDVNGSILLEHPEKMDEVADALVAEIIDFANGKATKSESLGFYELAIARVCNYV